jgi:hypothetical protein
VGCPAGPWAALGVSRRKKVVGFSFNITILPHIFRKSLMPKKAVVLLINNNFKVWRVRKRSPRHNPICVVRQSSLLGCCKLRPSDKVSLSRIHASAFNYV